MQYIILCLFLALPFAIVGLWKKRPVVAFIIAALLSYLMLVLPGLVQTFQAMMIYGSGDPELMAGGISYAFVRAALQMPIILPLLALFQFALRRIRRGRLTIQALKDFE